MSENKNPELLAEEELKNVVGGEDDDGEEDCCAVPIECPKGFLKRSYSPNVIVDYNKCCDCEYVLEKPRPLGAGGQYIESIWVCNRPRVRSGLY
jgi:hypothetical protein